MDEILRRTQTKVKRRLRETPLHEPQDLGKLPPVVTIEALGKVLETIREAKGLKLEEMAGADGPNPSTLWRVEKGVGYSHKSLGQYADALGMRLSLIYALAEHAGERGDKPIDDTIKLVLAIESLPEADRAHLQAVAVAFAERNRPCPNPDWDGVNRRKKQIKPTR